MFYLLKKLMIVLCSLACSLLALELVLRMFVSEAGPKQSSSDRPRRYYGADSSHPKQDFDYSEKREDNSWRMLVLGDSFSFGPELQLDDTFPKRLERFLNRNTSAPKAEVLNVGMSGYATVHESQLLPQLLDRYHPDFVLLQITLNDLEKLPYQNSKRALKLKIENLRRLRAKLDFSRLFSVVLERIINELSHREFIQYYQDSFSDAGNITEFKQALTQMQRVCLEHKVGFAAVLFPLFELPLDQSYPFQVQHTFFREELARVNVPLLDLFERYRGLDPYRLQLAPGRDLHPNEIAHRIAAEEIMRWFRKQSWIPESILPKHSSSKRDGKMLAKF